MPRMKDIDDILDAALDELEDDSDDGNSDIDEADQNNSTRKKGENMSQDAQHTQRPVFGPPRPPFMMSSDPNIAPAMSEEEEAVSQMMRQMENLFPSEDFGKDGNTHVNLSNGGNGDGNGDGNGNANENNVSNKRTDKSGTKSPDMNEAVNELLRKLSKGEEMNEGSFEGFGDEMTDEMRNEFESTMKGIGPSPLNGDEEDAMGNVVDGMMKQLLSREFMYEPMKDICARFPKWLAENKDKLTPEDYEKHGKQYQYFQKIVHLYEHDPDNIARLTELMNDLQEYGQPPAEIVKELAPGLEFDKDGMPKIDPSAGAPIPGMNEECSIM